MDLKSLLWHTVLASITGAYLIALFGVRAAHQHDVSHHSRRMTIAATIVGIWLVAYVSKQLMFGREEFRGGSEVYWIVYAPLFTVHMLLACTTIALGAYNLYMGIHRLRYGSVGAMSAGISRHRRLGKLLVWTFSGTMVTAYLIYALLFVWSPA